MGGSSTHRVPSILLALTAPALTVLAGACTDSSAEPDVVQPAAAYTAIVEWQAGEQEPVLDDNGKPKLPVIYVVGADGATVGVGVQAAVAEATVDDAVVRFADDVSDGFDTALEGSPVHDDGVMLAVGALPDPARTIDVAVARFVAQDDYEQLDVEITAIDRPTDTEPDAPTAEVTAVVQR